MIARLSSISRALPPQLGRDTRPGTDAARIASRYAYNGTFDRALALRERYQAEQSALGHQAVQVIRNAVSFSITTGRRQLALPSSTELPLPSRGVGLSRSRTQLPMCPGSMGFQMQLLTVPSTISSGSNNVSRAMLP